MDLTQRFGQKAKKPISGLANWLLVPGAGIEPARPIRVTGF
jgi:hypothetical protein